MYGVALSDLEEHLDSILKSQGFANSWELSAALARGGVPADTLISLLRDLDAQTARAAITRIAAAADFVGSSRRDRNWNWADIGPDPDRQGLYPHGSGTSTKGRHCTKPGNYTHTLAHLLQPSIKVESACPPVPVLVNTVGNELNQVWANLIENAIEAMLGQGELRLRTFREDHNVVVEISDNGPGIHPEIEPSIFGPFFTTKGIGEGTGLGLNTVQTIVRKHGGSIHVNSRPGDTRFQVWLPCADPSELDLPPDS